MKPPTRTVSPVTLRVEIPEIETRLLAERDIRHGAGYLARDERPPASGTLVVEQNPITRIYPVRLAVVDRDPVRVELRDAVRRARVERRRLGLGRLDDLAVQLRGRRLVEPDVLLEPARADRVEDAQRAQAVDVPRVLCHLERDLDVRLCAEVVDLRRLDLGDDVHEVGAVAQVAVVQLELVGT